MAGDPERKRKKKSGRGQGKSCGNIYPAEPTSSLGLLARVSSTVSSSRGVRPACGAAQPFSNQTPQGRRHGRDLIQSRALEGGNAKLLPAPAAAVAASWVGVSTHTHPHPPPRVLVSRITWRMTNRWADICLSRAKDRRVGRFNTPECAAEVPSPRGCRESLAGRGRRARMKGD